MRDRWSLVVRSLDYSDRLGEVRAPTLVCVGPHDPQAPVGRSGELAQGIPGTRLVILAKSGHYPFLEEAEIFNAELNAFFH